MLTLGLHISVTSREWSQGNKKCKILILRRNVSMEMTYDGALVLPSNCALMDEGEMRYV